MGEIGNSPYRVERKKTNSRGRRSTAARHFATAEQALAWLRRDMGQTPRQTGGASTMFEGGACWELFEHGKSRLTVNAFGQDFGEWA